MFNKSPFEKFMADEATLAQVLEFYGSFEQIAKKADLEKFLSNNEMQKVMSFYTGVEIDVLVAQAEKLLALY